MEKKETQILVLDSVPLSNIKDLKLNVSSYKLLWFNQNNEWWYDCDTDEPYAESTKNFKWVYLADILENINQPREICLQ